MIAHDTSQALSASQEALGAFRREMDALLQQCYVAADVEAIYHTMLQELQTRCEATQSILYAVDRERRALYSKLALEPCTGRWAEFLPIHKDNMLGYCALRGKPLNIRDAHAIDSWEQANARFRFDPTWDDDCAWRTQQLLTLPMLVDRKYLMGLLVLVNKPGDDSFSALEEAYAQIVADTLALALHRGTQPAPRPPGQVNPATSQTITVVPPPARPPLQLEPMVSQAVPMTQELQVPVLASTTQAMEIPAEQSSRRLGKFDMLLEQGHITPEDLSNAAKEARRKGSDVESLLLGTYRVPKAALGEALSRFYGCPFLAYDERTLVDRSLLANLNLEFLKTNTWVPLRRDGATIDVLLDNPKDLLKTEHIQLLLRDAPLRWLVGLRGDILQYLAQASGRGDAPGSIQDILGELSDGEAASSDEDDGFGGLAETDSSIVRLANQVIVDAYQRGASDIHIEPYAARTETVIRMRIDGRCLEYQRIPPSYRRALVSRLKIMARLDIAERRKPQDGKIKFRLPQGREIELRVATIPTAQGDEDVVMRVLAASEPLPLPALQMTPRNLEALQRLISVPYGLFLVVGPTGSGKTTTLHAALGAINTPERKIWTAEDPVEITQYGLRQVQVQPRIGFTFAAAMRAFLRADPDVIMVGEMRDEETAHTGIEASLTGHLVFSTLHTNSAPETITRLLDMGLDPFNFADALLGVLAQRLARTLCKNCKAPYVANAEQFAELRQTYGPEAFDARGLVYTPDFQLWRGMGCVECNQTGYRGRVGIHELLVATPEVKRLIQQRARIAEVGACAQAEGMTTLVQDGVLKVLAGVTDLAQVKAVASK